MVATIQKWEQTTTPTLTVNGNGHDKRISWEDFKRRYLAREDKYKYEWVKGTIEKTTRAMTQRQQFIYQNLLRFLLNLNGQNDDLLSSEVDTFFLDEVHRRPDIAYFSADQSARMAHGIEQVPEFLIEFMSQNDLILDVHKKMENYRDAKVKVVWHIFVELNEIHVYQGQDLSKMLVCKGADICSAEPVIAGFLIAAQDVFKKPALPTSN